MRQFKAILTSLLICALFFSYQPAAVFAAVYDDDADDLTYSISSDKKLDLDEDDFNDVCLDLTDEDLDYVKFRLPDEDDGILYYNYDKSDDENTEVSSSRKYYYDQSPYLSKVTFVPDRDFSGTLTIRYTGYNEDGDSYSGKLKITVKATSSSSDAISYTVDYDEDYVKFDEDDFYDVCEELQDEELDYVKFTLPDKKSGVLYYNYSSSKDDDDNTAVTSSRKYYYDSSPYLSRVSFVPDEDYAGTVTIKYTGYDIDGDQYSGKIKITVGDDDDTASSNTVTYQLKNTDDYVRFDEEDFIDLCDDLNDEELDYVKFSIPSSSKGTLYYNYSNGQYSSVVTSSKKYYIDSSPYLSDVTFVPDEELSATCKIDFEGWDVEGDSFTGSILITIGSGSAAGETITYTGKANTATVMKDSDFNKVCMDLMGYQLNYVYFTLPSESSGTLYYGYTQGGNYSARVKSNTKYYYDGSPYLLNVSFVPSGSFTGSVTINYTGYDIKGLSYSGTIKITAGGSVTPPVDTTDLISSKYFSDVDTSYSWAVPYIDSLYESSIISGSSSVGSKLYSPAAAVTRGDFMLILYRAMNLKTSSTASKFTDVPSGSYYYDAIMTARALGIAQGSDNYFYPNNPITREDAMVFVLRAVNITGKTIPSGDTSSLSSYYDNGSISDYSRSAVAALVKAGIITGSDDNKIHPQGNLTRAQIAAVIYRVINM